MATCSSLVFIHDRLILKTYDDIWLSNFQKSEVMDETKKVKFWWVNTDLNVNYYSKQDQNVLVSDENFIEEKLFRMLRMRVKRC